MSAVRNALVAALLMIACAVGLQVSFLLVQAATMLNDVHLESQRALLSVNQTLELVRGATREQRTYYKVAGKALAITTIHLGRLVKNTDARLDRTENRLARLAANTDSRAGQLTQAAEGALDNFGVAALTLAGQTDTLGHQANLLLAASRGAVENLERLAGSPALVRSTENLERSTANLEKTTAATAEAAGHVRDMLSPRKKSFWRRLLGLLIPRPSVPIVK